MYSLSIKLLKDGFILIKDWIYSYLKNKNIFLFFK